MAEVVSWLSSALERACTSEVVRPLICVAERAPICVAVVRLAIWVVVIAPIWAAERALRLVVFRPARLDVVIAEICVVVMPATAEVVSALSWVLERDCTSEVVRPLI